MQVPCDHCGRHLGPFCGWVSLMAWPSAFEGAMEKALAPGRNFHLSRVAHPAPALFQRGAQCLRNNLPSILVFRGDHESPAVHEISLLQWCQYNTRLFSTPHLCAEPLPSGYGNGWRSEGNFACFFDALLSWRHLC